MPSGIQASRFPPGTAEELIRHPSIPAGHSARRGRGRWPRTQPPAGRLPPAWSSLRAGPHLRRSPAPPKPYPLAGRGRKRPAGCGAPSMQTPFSGPGDAADDVRRPLFSGLGGCGAPVPKPVLQPLDREPVASRTTSSPSSAVVSCSCAAAAAMSGNAGAISVRGGSTALRVPRRCGAGRGSRPTSVRPPILAADRAKARVWFALARASVQLTPESLPSGGAQRPAAEPGGRAFRVCVVWPPYSPHRCSRPGHCFAHG